MDDRIEGIKTGAKPEIWTDRKGFEESTRFLSTEAAKLDDLAADADRSAMAGQFMLVGKDGCRGCHEDFWHKLPGTDLNPVWAGPSTPVSLADRVGRPTVS